jgi:hypothetical protein
MIPILKPEQRWECPNCDLKDVTHESQPHTRMHNCAKFGGFTAPMVPEGTKAKVELKVREDYVGHQNVTYDENGRPISAVETTRNEGNDVAAFAPCASIVGGAN